MKFSIRWMAVLALIAILAACGGTGGSNSSNSTTSPVSSGGGTLTIASSSKAGSTPAASGSSSSFNASIVWTPVAAAPGAVTVISPDSSIDAGTVVTFGQTFPQGEVPAGQFIQARQGSTDLPTQTVVKRRHADNSVRHAILSVQLPAATATSPAKASIALTLAATGSNAAGSALVIADVTGSSSPNYRVEIVEKSLLKDGSTAATEAGSIYNADLKTALAGTTDVWLTGALTTEWRARVAPTTTTPGLGAHDGLRVIFDARYQSASQGRVSIAMENVESNTARGDRIYDLRVYKTSGSTTEVVYEQLNLKHYAHTRFRKAFYFGSGSEELLAIVDSVRLKNSRAVPNYASIAIPEGVLATTYSDWQASGRGLYQPAKMVPGMPSAGGRDDIGPLPGWTARAIISGDPRMYQIMLDHADRAGMWNIHWRDSLKSGVTLQNASFFSIDDHPQFSLVNPSYATDSYVGSTHFNYHGDSLPAPTLPLTKAAGWDQDDAHEPSLNYLPYIVTGDRFYLDELYFYAAWHHIHHHWSYRGSDKGWYSGSVTREMAWKLRTGGHAAWIAPDSDWQKTYFNDKVQNSFDWYRTNVLTSNTLGYWTGWSNDIASLAYSPGGVSLLLSPWQHDYMAYVLYELCERGFAATDLRDFALGFTVRRFSSGADFNRLDGAVYRLPAQLTGGSALTSMAQINHYAFGGASYAARNPSAPTTPAGYYEPNGFVSIALMTLAAAIDTASGTPSTQSEAYVWLRSQVLSSTYSTIARSNYIQTPTWNIVPRNPVIGLSEAPGIY